MRFASIQGSNAGDYAAAGKAVSGAASNIFSTARKYGPDYSGLGQVAIKTRSDEKQAAIAAETAVAKAGLTSVGNVKSTQLTTDASVKKAEINADAKLHVFDQGLKTKMAGKLAAVGTASAAALSSGKSKRPRAPSNIDYSELKSKFQGELDAANKARDSILKKSTGSDVPSNSTGNTGTKAGNSDKTGGGISYKKVPDSLTYGVSIIDIGKALEGKGWTVGEHSAFGGTADVHADNSYHNYDEALDITDWRDGDWQGRTSQLRDDLSQFGFAEVLGPGDKGHNTHVHLAIKGGQAQLTQQQMQYLGIDLPI